MPEPLEGLDPTAEAETDVSETEATPDHASLQRALRDLEAAKSRVERDARREADELRAKLVAELLPVLDNLDRTIEAAEQCGDSGAIAQGVRMVRSQFANVLARYGLERVDARNQRFDPRLHDAIGTVPVSQPAAHDLVIDQIEPGYRFGTRLLRPAKVLVGRLVSRYH
jgi:molecular chaperone GrpE